VVLKSILAAATLCIWAGAAQAELKICNETQDVQGVSIGYKGEADWTSEGWWNIQPGDCATPVSGDLKQRYYYYRAEVDGGPFEGEDYTFCTSPDVFTIVGDTDCEARGYEKENFSEIDTGTSAKSYTFTLTSSEPANPAPKPEASAGAGTDAATEDGLKICNKTEFVQGVSIGYEGDKDWTSEGWWNIEPGACSTVLGKLDKRYFYYRAEVDGGDFAGQNYFFCTSPQEYTIVGDKDCEARGYDREDFAEIDTGGTEAGFTLTLVPDAPASDPAPSEPTADNSGGLKICNETDYVQGVSVGYEGEEGWTSEGWWNIDPGDCSTPVSGKLKKRYYYYRAEIDGGDFDGGGYFFCTTPSEYTIVGDTDCESRGYDREDFAEIDTGETATSFVFTMVGAAAGDAVPNEEEAFPMPEPKPAPKPVPTVAPEPESAPVQKPPVEPKVEPEPAPKVVPDNPAPTPTDKPSTPRRGGSRGG
jgi:uncharacterized membrane protein